MSGGPRAAPDRGHRERRGGAAPEDGASAGAPAVRRRTVRLEGSGAASGAAPGPSARAGPGLALPRERGRARGDPPAGAGSRKGAEVACRAAGLRRGAAHGEPVGERRAGRP
ncbi:hypothetical protein GCM10017688_11500 [Streptomyces ramulosus]